MPMIEKAKSSKFINKWTMAAGAVVVGAGLLMFGQGDNNNEKQREPEATSADNAEPRVDPNQRFFIARVPSVLYAGPNTTSRRGVLLAGSCVNMVGAKGEFTNTHILTRTPGDPPSGFTDFNNFANTNVRRQEDCIATIEGVHTGGFAPSERYYTIGGTVPIPLYRNASGQGEVITYIEPNSCTMRDGDGAIMPLIAQNAQGVRHRGYAPFESSPYGTFNSPLMGLAITITDTTCIATFTNSATASASTPVYVPQSVAPPAPAPDLPPPN